MAGTFPTIDKPTPDEEFEEETIDDVGGAIPVLSGDLPVVTQDDHQCRTDDGNAFAAPDADNHLLTHKPSDPNCDACFRGKMKNLRKYAGAFSRPTTQFGDIFTMDHCSFYDGGMQYSLSGKVIAICHYKR